MGGIESPQRELPVMVISITLLERGPKMKKHLKVFGLVAILMGLPLAFTGGTAETPLGVKINDGCASGCCAIQIGSFCTGDGLELFNYSPRPSCFR